MRRVIVFDLDGTLIDSVGDLHTALCETLDRVALPPIELDDTRRFVGNGARKLIERTLDHLGSPLDPTRITAAFVEQYQHMDVGQTQVYPGVISLLEKIRHHPLAICTNKPLGPTHKVLAATGLAPFFRAVIGGDSLAVLKPDPRPLHMALQMLGAGSTIDPVFIGDSEVDEATAKAANVPFALYTEGYRKKPADAFTSAFTFGTYEELGDWLMSRP